MADFYQANLDGTVEMDVEPSIDYDRILEILETALQSENWNLVWVSRETPYEVQLVSGTVTTTLHINIRPIQNTSRTSPNDKRIQGENFTIINDPGHKSLLLGIYERHDMPIIIGWDVNAFSIRGRNHAPKVRVHTIADAMRDGFSVFTPRNIRRKAFAFQQSLLPAFINTIEDLFKVPDELPPVEAVDWPEIILEDEFPRNRIIYGAPGTGKSRKINDILPIYFPHEELYLRITLHPQFTYSHFIGMYRPVPIYYETDNTYYEPDMVTEAMSNLEPIIDYRFEAGPFLKMLCKALKYPTMNFLLIIEEINRANVAAVFGDLFQLLDRDESGRSEYGIEPSNDIVNYMNKNGIDLKNAFKLPSNLYLWATMNSADQGVYPMDAAFKRRWSFEYISLNENETVMDPLEISLKFMKDATTAIIPIKWNMFRTVLNDFLKVQGVMEDKLIGPFFLKPQELQSDYGFKNKLLLYLRDDVLRHNPEVLFLHATFSDIIRNYDNGEEIFKIHKDTFMV